MQPTFEPGTRSQGARCINVGGLVEQQSHKTVDVVAQLIEVDIIQFLSRLNAEPKLLVIVVKNAGKSVNKRGEVFLVGRIDLFPIDHHTSRFGAAENRQHVLNKAVLPVRGSVRQVLDRFRLPRVAHQIRQQRH